MTKRDLIPRIGRWWLLTQEFDFNVVYRPGTKMRHVDALSRNSVQGKDEHFDDELHIFCMGLNEGDWVMAAEVSDTLCKQLYTTLSNQPINKEEKRVHDEYKIEYIERHLMDNGGMYLKLIVLKLFSAIIIL
jgi:hypothetical protein